MQLRELESDALPLRHKFTQAMASKLCAFNG
ncbi:hypothetical protein chiPu_0030528, partial [Chiloscyllium punctatum]|nr:hypothetical protein [Chiloscyllium punctatum]